MGISIREFKVAMETLGAERLADRHGSRYNYLVPCFIINGTQFFHSGSYYIVNSGKPVSGNIMSHAMAELGENHPGGDNFWWGEVHSIRGMLTIATMLRGDYSKDFVDELTNKAYQKVLDCSLIKRNAQFPFEFSNHSSKMQELRKLLEEYSDAINPFGNCDFKIKAPIEYLDKVKVQFSVANEESSKVYSHLKLEGPSGEASFIIDDSEWFYRSDVSVTQNGEESRIYLNHYYDKGNSTKNADEVLYLYNVVSTNNCEHIDFRISLKSGFAWETYEESKAKLVTDEQLDIAISYLKMSIEILKKEISSNIVDANKF